MQYLIRLAAAPHMVVLTLPIAAVKQSAIDFIFDVVGNANIDELVVAGILEPGQLDDLKGIQALIFDSDAQGLFIRDGASFKANGHDLEPDALIETVFLPAEHNGIKYMRCDLLLESEHQAIPDPPPTIATDNSIKDLARTLFLHQIAAGPAIDVTKEYPELAEAISDAERDGWIEVDVEKVSYRLTASGKRLHDSYMAEAQDLIRRFDIYADVDIDSSGCARFDTGLGRDLRVAAMEMESVDPFRARFLLGLNDGEWDHLSNWYEVFEDSLWYGRIFETIERAPGIDDIGRERMASIMDQAKAVLRKER